MREVARAAGDNVVTLEQRVTVLEGLFHAHAQETRTLLGRVLERLGVEEDGGQPPTGLYGKINSVDKKVDVVSTRLGWFEKLREKAVGAAWALALVVPSGGAVLWWLAGPRSRSSSTTD